MMDASDDAPGPLRVLREFTVAKNDDFPNEDRLSVSVDKLCCAISDGASVSYDPGPWAEVLCQKFTACRNISSLWLAEAVTAYSDRYNRDAMGWAQQAAFDRGSSATLIGVECSEDGRNARVFGVGDSILAFVENGKILKTFPYVQANEFDKAPILFSTCTAENLFINDEFVGDAWCDLILASHNEPLLLLMTDALGRWLLDDPSTDRVSRLVCLEGHKSFQEFVERERLDGRLKRDDTSLIVMGR